MPFNKHGPIRICIAFNHQKLCHLEKSQENFGQTLDPKTDAHRLIVDVLDARFGCFTRCHDDRVQEDAETGPVLERTAIEVMRARPSSAVLSVAALLCPSVLGFVARPSLR